MKANKWIVFMFIAILLATLIFTVNLATANIDYQYEFKTKWGELGSSPSQFSNQRGVAVDLAGNVYVADSGNNRIQKFDKEGNFIRQWGALGTGDGNFSGPSAIAVDLNGTYVYVTEAGTTPFANYRVQKFTSDGVFVQKWGSNAFGTPWYNYFTYPMGIAVSSVGNVYVADTGNHRIIKFTPDGQYIRAWGKTGASFPYGAAGSGDGEFNMPMGLAVDFNDNVYVADYANNRIQVFTFEGAFITSFGSYGSDDGQFMYPNSVALPEAKIAGSPLAQGTHLIDTVYAIDDNTPRVQVFNAEYHGSIMPNGTLHLDSVSVNFLTKFGRAGSSDGEFGYLQGIGVIPEGNTDSSLKPDVIYVSDTGHNRIQKFAQALPANAFLIVRGANNQIYYRTYNTTTSTWNGWTGLPGASNDPPAAAVMGNELHIVVRGVSNSQIWHGYVNLATNAFSGWTLLSGATPSPPTLSANSTHLYLVVRGNDNVIYYRFYTLSSRVWSGWTAVPAGTTPDTPAAQLIDNKLQIVVRGSNNNQIWHGTLNLASNTWSGWNLLSGATPSPPVLTSMSGYLCLVVRGNNNAIYHRWYSLASSTWYTDWIVLPAGTTPDSPAATITGETYLQIVVRGSNYDQIWHGYLNIWTNTWSGWTQLSGSTPSKPVLTS